ncbi:hypothetical protein SCHIN_v1c07450 [Spiroplasma chinense]|uniref:Uncharacterized protein n=1 Tax=Spiroplasma chinense TaxID=216932 RepID=A0A5B9Y4Q8_9MOLU|nr:hypothetical protein [Spiroplasma chinense]QEH61940.1 hypothetical protein SCHIN_v1c07450 [Spiroplasma chinense]
MIKSIKYLFTTVIGSLSISTVFVNDTITATKNNIVVSYSENTSGSSSTDEFMWAGRALQYFLYKNSDISENTYVNDLVEKVSGRDGYESDSSIFFEMGLIGSIVNISMYGLTSYQEFFAEAYAKWQTTEDSAKNKSWELLNYFFMHVYNVIKNSYSGAISDVNWENVKNWINENPVKDSLKYNTSKTSVSGSDLTYNDLQYLSSQIGVKNYNYTLKALATSFGYWNYDGNLSYGQDKVLKTLPIDKEDVEKFQTSNFMNDTFTKASSNSISEFDEYKEKLKEEYFATYDEMDEYYLEHTKFTSTTSSGSTINFLESVNNLQKHFGWSDVKTDGFKNQMLEMINLTLSITKWDEQDYFLYYFFALVISPDYPLSGTQEGVMAYTSSYFYNNSIYTSTAFASIVVSGKSIDMFSDASENDQYQQFWWSTPNIYATINHEMGHVLDGYLGITLEKVKSNVRTWKTILNSNALSIYEGKSFADGSFKKNNIATIVASSVGLIGGLVGGSLIFYFLVIKPKRKKKQ